MRSIKTIFLLLITAALISGCYTSGEIISTPKEVAAYSKILRTGDIIITHKDWKNPISWWGHSALMVSDDLVGEYPQICDGYYETPHKLWLRGRDVKAILKYKHNTPEFKQRLIHNINKAKNKRYAITHKTDNSKFYCSQYIWQVYWQTAKDLGTTLDIDSDGGSIVMPYDLINEKYFQVFYQ